MKINAYLFFNGQCETAFKFYERHLGGKTAFRSVEQRDRHRGGWEETFDSLEEYLAKA